MNGSRNLLIFPNLIIIDLVMGMVVRTFEPLSPRLPARHRLAAGPPQRGPRAARQPASTTSSPSGDRAARHPRRRRGAGVLPAGLRRRLKELAWSDISRGMLKAHPNSTDETQMRTFWRRWDELMTGDADELRAPGQVMTSRRRAPMDRYALRFEVEEFLYHEADLLDRWELEAWLDLFAPGDCEYSVPPTDRPDADPRQHTFLIHDDRFLLTQRVKSLLTKTAHAEWPHSRTQAAGGERPGGGGRRRRRRDRQLRRVPDALRPHGHLRGHVPPPRWCGATRASCCSGTATPCSTSTRCDPRPRSPSSCDGPSLSTDSGSADQLDGAANAGRPGQALVGREERRVEQLGKRNVGRVVDGQVVAELPAAREQPSVGHSDHSECAEIGEGLSGPISTKPVGCAETSQNGDDLELDQLGRAEPLSAQAGADMPTVASVVRQSRCQDARIDHDHRASRSARMSCAAVSGRRCRPCGARCARTRRRASASSPRSAAERGETPGATGPRPPLDGGGCDGRRRGHP